MGLYVYGIIAYGESHEPGGAMDVRRVTEGDVAALVREMPDDVEPGADSDLISRHVAVLSEWGAEPVLLPVDFGTVIPDENVLRTLLREGREELAGYFDELRGKAQISLRALWREDAKPIEEAEDNSAAAPPSDSPATGARENGSSENGARPPVASTALTAEYILDDLARHAEDVHIEEPRGERMILEASFLIPHQQLEAFDAELEQIDAHFDDEVLFQYIGPLPPYHFVRLQLKA